VGIVSAASTSRVSEEKRPVPGGAPLAVWLIARIVTIVASCLLFGYAAWSGVGNFLGVQNQSLRLGLDLTPVGWGATLTLVVLPVILFAACIVITRRMRVSHTVFTFAVGFAIVSVVTLNIVLALPQTAIYAT
jgi:hypothetical protein